MDMLEKVERVKELKIEDVIGVYMILKPEGKNFTAICPFHPETKPTLKISPEKNLFKCFVCGTGGDAITFVKEFRQIEFIDAVNVIAFDHKIVNDL